MQKNIVVAAEIYSENLGDYLIFQSISKLLRERGFSISPIDISMRTNWSAETRDKGRVCNSLHNLPKYRTKILRTQFIRNLFSLYKWTSRNRSAAVTLWDPIIKKADCVIIGGGQLLTDTNLEFPLPLSVITRLAKKHRKPLAIFGCGVGRDWSFPARIIYRYVTSQAVYVGLRDQESYTRLQRRGKQTCEAFIHPDVVFALGMTESKNKIKNKADLTCGLNILPLSVFHRYVPALRDFGLEDYLKFWERLATGVVEDGFVVTLITNGSIRDHMQAGLVARHLKACGVPSRLAPRPERPSDLLSLLQGLDCVVAMRMHSGILAFSLGKSVVPISWDSKVQEVWKTVAGDGFVVDSSVLRDKDPWKTLSTKMKLAGELKVERASAAKRVDQALNDCLHALGL